MTRVSLLLLAVLVLCALSLVTSRHQARRLFVELERAQSEARGYETEFGQLQLEQSTWGMPARVEKVAREQLRMQLPTSARTEVVATSRAEEVRGQARSVTARRPRPSFRSFARRWCSARSRCCSSGS